MGSVRQEEMPSNHLLTSKSLERISVDELPCVTKLAQQSTLLLAPPALIPDLRLTSCFKTQGNGGGWVDDRKKVPLRTGDRTAPVS